MGPARSPKIPRTRTGTLKPAAPGSLLQACSPASGCLRCRLAVVRTPASQGGFQSLGFRFWVLGLRVWSLLGLGQGVGHKSIFSSCSLRGPATLSRCFLLGMTDLLKTKASEGCRQKVATTMGPLSAAKASAVHLEAHARERQRGRPICKVKGLVCILSKTCCALLREEVPTIGEAGTSDVKAFQWFNDWDAEVGLWSRPDELEHSETRTAKLLCKNHSCVRWVAGMCSPTLPAHRNRYQQ